MDMARVVGGRVVMASLPYTWEYPDGRTVSGYCHKPLEELYAEGWREKIYTETFTEYTEENWVYDEELDKVAQKEVNADE